MTQMMKLSVRQHHQQNHNHKDKMIVKNHRTHMIYEFDKRLAKVNNLWQNSKAKLQKSLQGTFAPWKK